MNHSERWVNLALVGVSLLVSLVLVEGGLRIIGYHPPGLLDPRLYVANQSPILHHKLRPGYQGHFAGGKVTVDTDGYRVVRPKLRHLRAGSGSGAQRTILLLGDSFVFGQGLNDHETLASQLQDSLYARNLNYRVKNIGVPGYTSWNEYAALIDYLKQGYSADHVVLLYIPNDLSLDNDNVGIGRGEYSHVSNSPFHRFTRAVYKRFYTAFLFSSGVKRMLSAAHPSGPMRTDLSMAFDSVALANSMAAISRIDELCLRRGMRFSVAIWRDIAYYQRPDLARAYERQIATELSKRGIDSFLVASHTARLRLREAKVSWGDYHSSARAISHYVADILPHILRPH